MSEKYKLGLTRNRLFEFDNAVLFCGKYDFQKNGLEKALKLLCTKEPIITSRISLEDDGEAYVLTDSVEQKIIFCRDTAEELKKRYEKCGVAFYSKAFEFSYTSDGFIVIAAHTAVCDAKSLLRLAIDIKEFYKEPLRNVEPSDINLLSEKTDLPLEVASPVIDRLSADLDLKWQKDARVFNTDDYIKSKESFDKIKGGTNCICTRITERELCVLKEFCKKQNMDVVSFVGFAFYDALLQNIAGKKKFNKMNVYADERLFFVNSEDYRIGAYNGAFEVSYKKKYAEGDFIERAKAFHIDCYKNATSTFKVFYDDVLLMRVSPSLCDGSYMYKAGLFKSKTARTVAENYGCACEKMCDYFYCNLQQEYWRDIKEFEDIYVAEAFKMRCATALDFIMKDGEGYISFRYKTQKCQDVIARKIVDTAIGNIRKIQ